MEVFFVMLALAGLAGFSYGIGYTLGCIYEIPDILKKLDGIGDDLHVIRYGEDEDAPQ